MQRGPPGKLRAAAHAYYEKLPSAEEAASGGFTVADYERTVEVWPDSSSVWKIFLSLRTQWRDGINGKTGLDYNVVFRMLDDLGLDQSDRSAMFREVQVMELAALNAMCGGQPEPGDFD